MGKTRFRRDPLTRTACSGHLRCRAAGLLAAVLLSPALVNAAAGEQLQAGFAGYTWGTPFALMERQLDLTPVRETKHTVQYSTNLRQIGEIDHIECDVEFTDGLFSGVVLFVKQPHVGVILPALLSRYYGEQHREGPRACHWLTAETHAAYDEGSEGDAYVYIYARRFLSRSDVNRP